MLFPLCAGLQLRTGGSRSLLSGATSWHLKDAVVVTSPTQEQYHWMHLDKQPITQKAQVFLEPVVFGPALASEQDN